MTKTAKKEKKQIEIVEDFLEELFKLIGIKVVLETSEDVENESIVAKIESEEAGLLIGNRGATLNSIQVLTSLAVRKSLGDWKRVVIDISGWREKEQERLESLAFQAAERAKSTGESQHLYNLSSFQRRLVHIALSEDKEIETESEGEGQERYLVIRKKGSN